MANPILSHSTFDRCYYDSDGSLGRGTMTVKGAAAKGAVCSFIVLISSIAAGRMQFYDSNHFWYLPASAIALCCLVYFLPKTACILAPLFSILQGSILGTAANFVISVQLSIPKYFFLLFGIDLSELEFDLCSNSEVLFSTVCAAAIMSFTCGIGLFKAKQTAGFILFGCIIGTLLCFGLLLLSNRMGFTIVPIHSSMYYIGICFLFSIFLCWPVTFCLTEDFDNIRFGTLSNVPQYMEWYCAFALIFTLTWCYVKILIWLCKKCR